MRTTRQSRRPRALGQQDLQCGGPGQPACRVRPVFNAGPGGVRATYPGTSTIPNLTQGGRPAMGR